MNKTRPNRVYFRVTNEELEQIDKCVKESGMTRQDWILSVVTPLTDPQPNVKLCPECGAAMQIKNGRRGKFWGVYELPSMSSYRRLEW